MISSFNGVFFSFHFLYLLNYMMISSVNGVLSTSTFYLYFILWEFYLLMVYFLLLFTIFYLILFKFYLLMVYFLLPLFIFIYYDDFTY